MRTQLSGIGTPYSESQWVVNKVMTVDFADDIFMILCGIFSRNVCDYPFIIIRN